MRAVSVLAAAMSVFTGLGGVAIAADERFEPGKPDSAWKLAYQPSDAASIRWPAADEPAGLRFVSTGIAKFERPIDPLAGPMEMVADVDLDAGIAENWPRNNGLSIALSSAPVDAMQPDDWCILFQVIQQGAVATVKQGGSRWGRLRPNDGRNVWELPGRDIAPRFTLTMAGAGGRDQSVMWPAKFLNGTKLRFHAWRDAENVMRLTIHHADGPGGPWWEGEAPLPAKLQTVPLTHLTVFLSQDAKWFADITAANKEKPGAKGDGSGQGLFSGRVTHVAAEKLQGDRPRLNTLFPADPVAAAERPKGTPSAWLPKGGVEALREKFNDPAFAHYRTIILRNAAERNPDDTSPNNFDTNALTWAYVLTGERSYFDRLMAAIDTQCGVRNTPPAMKFGEPGNLRQLLDVQEFKVHRIESLAQAYDLVYDELDPPRREAMHRAMLRSLEHYVRQTDKGDWWYVNNPSNTIGVGNGTNGLIAVALRHQHPELAKQVLDRAVTLIQTRYVGVSTDGGCNEGNMYWNYGMSFPLMLGYVLQNAEGNDRALIKNEKVANARRYIETNLGGDGKLIPFNDTQPWLNGWVVMSASAGAFDQPLMRWMSDHMAQELAEKPGYPEQQRGPYAIMAFLFRDRTPAPKEFPGVPTISVLPSLNEAVLRSDGAFVPRLVTGIKGNGQTNTHHANQDQGSFVLYADGQMVLLDPGYFEDGPAKHSLPTVGDPDKMVLNHTAECAIGRVWEQGDLRSASVDATAAYNTGKNLAKPLVNRARRVFVQVGDKALIVLEDIEPKQATDPVTTHLQAGVPVEARDAGASFTLAKGSVQLHTFGPKIAFTVTPQKWKKEWVYFKSGVAWSRLAAGYTAEPGAPLVMVFARDATAPQVQYADGRITAKVGDATVNFERRDGQWEAVQPAGN